MSVARANVHLRPRAVGVHAWSFASEATVRPKGAGFPAPPTEREVAP
jgi:hypothetical protein